MDHTKYMQIAINEALLAASEGEIPVGAVLVQNDKIIAQSHNQRELLHDATCHAEINVIRKACSILGNWRLSDCTLYVTLEPCPMCAGAIVNARISKLVYGAPDSQAGGVESIFNITTNKNLNHKVEILSGICEDKCRSVLQEFLLKQRKIKIASSKQV